MAVDCHSIPGYKKGMTHITLWVVLGTCLLVAEMMTGTFFLLFFSLGAFCASLSALFGLNSFPLQIVVCGVVSVVGFVLLKKPLQKKFLKTAQIQNDIGQKIKIDTAIPAGKSARIAYQGTTWDAQNNGSVDLQSGDLALIVGTDGPTLLIQKQKN